MLTTTELAKLTSDVADVDVSKSIAYGQALLSEAVYIVLSTTVASDTVLYLRSAKIGTICELLQERLHIVY